MLASLEFLIGSVCSLMGIALGYTVLIALMAGMQLIARRRESDDQISAPK